MSGPSTNQKLQDKQTEWVKEHIQALFRYALLRVRRRDVAEDLVQETFLAAIKAKDRFRGKSSERTWLIGILRHKIFDFMRQKCKDSSAGPQSCNEPASTEFFDKHGNWSRKPSRWKADPAEIAENREFLAVVQKCLSELPDGIAEAFVLREVESIESREVCGFLHISESNLWVRLHRARLQLRQCLENNWFSVKGGGR